MLTVQVTLQSEHIVRRVLVHRRIGRRTDDDGRIGGISEQDDRTANQNRIKDGAVIELLTEIQE